MPVKKKVAKKKKKVSGKKASPKKSVKKPVVLDSSTLEMKVTLIGSKPAIWRKLQISSQASLDQLHTSVQICMGWKNAHMYRFDVDGETFRQADPEYPGAYKSLQTKLSQLELQEKESILYTNDLADSWEHEIIIEKIQSNRNPSSVPVCLGGDGNCPPEDSGGIRAYQESQLQKGKSKPKGKSTGENGHKFSSKEANQLLQRKFRKK